ncbi:MAG: sensor histidine kinase [Planctomycetes bacterium]|nr:sensor histidine kinase [Planctomycetota bacterium]
MNAWLQSRIITHSPLRVWLLVVAVVSVTEAAVMLALPVLLPAESTVEFGAIVDSFLLTVSVAPLLWWFIERPLRRTNKLRAEFLAEYFDRTESERRHIASDLHDGVGQSLTLLVSGLASAAPLCGDPENTRRLERLCQVARTTLLDVKRLALGLRPSLLDDLGLGPALEAIIVDCRENQPIQITLDTSHIGDRRLADPVETAVFRIAQEAITNIVKHSHATRASVSIRFNDDTVELDVRDNGCGIPEQYLEGHNGRQLGLTSMKERATLLGGRLTIKSEKGQGTQLSVQIPAKER